MKGNTSWIVANLDLADAVFTALSPRIHELAGLTGPVHRLDRLNEADRSNKLGIILMFQRRIDPSMRSISPVLAALGQCEKIFEEAQLKQRIQRVLLVDCSEIPNAPMSHFTVLSQYLESLATTAPATSSGTIACLDYEIPDLDTAELTNIQFWDTRSDEFMEHMQQYMIESLRSLNFDLNPAVGTE
jgi:hypothetical protein